MSGKYLRPAVHAGALGFVFLEPLLGRWGMAATAAAVTLVNLLVLPRTAFGKALRREGEPLVNGQVTYPLAIAAAYALFPDPGVAAMAWAVMALGDPSAALAGSASQPNGPRLPWNRRKSLAGSMAFLVVGGIAAVLALEFGFRFGLFTSGVFQFLKPPEMLLFCGIATVVGTIVESLPLPIDDNLPIVLAVGAAVSYPPF